MPRIDYSGEGNNFRKLVNNAPAGLGRVLGATHGAERGRAVAEVADAVVPLVGHR
jgi:hypothetical protein